MNKRSSLKTWEQLVTLKNRRRWEYSTKVSLIIGCWLVDWNQLPQNCDHRGILKNMLKTFRYLCNEFVKWETIDFLGGTHYPYDMFSWLADVTNIFLLWVADTLWKLRSRNTGHISVSDWLWLDLTQTNESPTFNLDSNSRLVTLQRLVYVGSLMWPTVPHLSHKT